MAGAIALGFARWLEKLRVALCIHRCIRRLTFYAPDRFHSLYSLVFILHDVNLPRPIGASLDTPLWLARAGGIFAWYHKVIIYHALPYRHVYSPRTTRATLAQVKRCALQL